MPYLHNDSVLIKHATVIIFYHNSFLSVESTFLKFSFETQKGNSSFGKYEEIGFCVNFQNPILKSNKQIKLFNAL